MDHGANGGEGWSASANRRLDRAEPPIDHGMMLITLPVFMPIVQRLDIDLIWFGVLYLICMQLGLLLPPHGLLLMTMKGVAPKEVTMAHIFRAVVPYVGMSLVLLVIIIMVPAIATWLPNVLG